MGDITSRIRRRNGRPDGRAQTQITQYFPVQTGTYSPPAVVNLDPEGETKGTRRNMEQEREGGQPEEEEYKEKGYGQGITEQNEGQFVQGEGGNLGKMVEMDHMEAAAKKHRLKMEAAKEK